MPNVPVFSFPCIVMHIHGCVGAGQQHEEENQRQSPYGSAVLNKRPWSRLKNLQESPSKTISIQTTCALHFGFLLCVPGMQLIWLKRSPETKR